MVTGEAGRESLVRRWSAESGINLVARQVCEKRCNSGWMSRLESRVKPFLTHMISAQQKTLLSVADQRALAAWATKTTMTQALTTPGRHIKLPHYQRFGTVIQPLPLSIVLIGTFDGFSDRLLRADPRLIRFQAEGVDIGPDSDAVCATNLIGHFIFQVVIHDIGTHKVTVDDSANTQGFLQQIWPLSGADLVWPPRLVLNDAAYEELRLKCASRVRVLL